MKLNLKIYSLLIFTFSFQVHAQIDVEQDAKFEQLLKQKSKTSSSQVSNDRYKIQIFSGDNENSRKTLNEIKKNYKELESTIVFHTPNYKVWVGNFKNRIEAERALAEIRQTYSNAFLIKPSK